MSAKSKRREVDESEASQHPQRKLEAVEIQSNEATRGGVYAFTFIIFLVGFFIGFGLSFFIVGLWGIACGVILGLLCAASVRIAVHWERVAILRFGRFNRIVGPGVFFCVPFIEYATIRVDQRVITSAFSAEASLTADLVPVDVDAILFWMVWDAKKACLEVENYPQAVLRSAQTALRDAIGQMNLADISIRRKQIDHELEKILADKCEPWGITVLSTEIRDIMIPHDLQNALSKEAQAERERNSRIILAEVEKDISEMFVEAAQVYEKHPEAMKLRAMNLAYESAREGKGILLAPSTLSEGFDLGKLVNK